MSVALNCDGRPDHDRIVFSAGVGRDRLQTKVCPGFILQDSDAPETVEWWLCSTPRDPWTGMPSGTPDWPWPGGWLRQPAKLVDAVLVLQAEYQAIVAARDKPKGGPSGDQAPAESPGKVIRRARRRRQ